MGDLNKLYDDTMKSLFGVDIKEGDLISKKIKSLVLISEESTTPRLIITMANSERINIDGELGIVDYLKSIK